MHTQAHFFLKNYDEAHAAYSKALALAPNDELIAQALADVAAEQTRQLRRARLQKMISHIKTQQLCPQVMMLLDLYFHRTNTHTWRVVRACLRVCRYTSTITV